MQSVLVFVETPLRDGRSQSRGGSRKSPEERQSATTGKIFFSEESSQLTGINQIELDLVYGFLVYMFVM
jgi:hypothetical protein